MEHYTGLVLLYFILWLVVRLYRGPVDFTWWPIKSDDEDAINEDMEDYVESNRFIVFANATPEIKRVILKSDYIEKLENKKNYTESFSFLKDNKINSFDDVCQKIIEKKCIVTLKLKNDDIEKGYLTKKIEKYYYFEILNDEFKIISTEIFDEHYIEEIQIDTNDKINKNENFDQ